MLTRVSSDYIAHLDGYTIIAGGWLNHNWVQLGYQVADSLAGGAYSFFGTCLILAALDGIGKYLPIFKLRASEDEEVLGIDDVEIGEFAVSFSFLLRVWPQKLTVWSSTIMLNLLETSACPMKTSMMAYLCAQCRTRSTAHPWAVTMKRTMSR